MSGDASSYLDRLGDGVEIEADPVLPGWAGVATLFGAPVAAPADARADVIAAGVPYDATASSRPGAAEGPLAIRVASRVMAAQLASAGAGRMHDPRTGTTFEYARPHLCDVGDLPVYPTDPLRNFDSLASRAADLAMRARKLVFLGGDHSIAFPLFVGVSGAHRGEVSGIGYVQVDHHFDFGDRSAIHGRLYHGSNARRISELPGFEPRHMAFVGVGHPTRFEQHRGLVADGCQIVTAREILGQGAPQALAALMGALGECRAVYLSVDVDVLDAAFAPGTGGVTIGGLDPATLLDVLLTLAALPIRAIDVVEVAPRYDAGGRTAQLVAQLLFEFLFRAPG